MWERKCRRTHTLLGIWDMPWCTVVGMVGSSMLCKYYFKKKSLCWKTPFPFHALLKLCGNYVNLNPSIWVRGGCLGFLLVRAISSGHLRCLSGRRSLEPAWFPSFVYLWFGWVVWGEGGCKSREDSTAVTSRLVPRREPTPVPAPAYICATCKRYQPFPFIYTT